MATPKGVAPAKSCPPNINRKPSGGGRVGPGRVKGQTHVGGKK